MTNKMYINVETGSVDDYDGWWYEDETGDTVNAVDRGEVIEVVEYKGEWMEPEKVAAKQAAAALGRLGRAAMTEAQATASRENGKKGGRPRKDA